MSGDQLMEIDVELSVGLQEILEAGQFSKCEIDLTTLFDANGNLNAEVGEFFQLSCLGALRKTSTHFVPDRIYVRSEMKDLFPGLLIKRDQDERRKILTGSPGIGKSVLFFLAALRCQLLPQNANKKVAYIRKVDEEPVSYYLMEPGSSGNSVKMIYSQNIEPSDHENLFVMFKEFRGYTNKIKNEDYVAFVDGPNHNQKMDLLNNGFDFLCTSGGWPTPSQSAIFVEDAIILGAWKEVPEKSDATYGSNRGTSPNYLHTVWRSNPLGYLGHAKGRWN